MLKKLENIPQEDPLIQKYVRLTTLDTKSIMIKTKSWECMGKFMSVLEMDIQGKLLAMLLWQKKATLLYTMRYIGKTPFYYLIHRETRDHWGSTGTGKDAELNKGLL